MCSFLRVSSRTVCLIFLEYPCNVAQVKILLETHTKRRSSMLRVGRTVTFGKNHVEVCLTMPNVNLITADSNGSAPYSSLNYQVKPKAKALF
jgi:hypothetical protein